MTTTAAPEAPPTADLALTLMPMPARCGKPVTVKDHPRDKDTCRRDTGHKGKHRGWAHPSCGSCGQEMRFQSRTVSYLCSCPGVAPEAKRRAWELGRVQRDVAYAMTGYPDSGQAPTTEQYDLARRIVVALELEDLLQ